MGLPFTRGGVTTPPVAMVTLWSQGTGPGSLSPGPQTQEAADILTYLDPKSVSKPLTSGSK